MKFNKKHLVIVNTLNKEEAIAFIKFLESEIIRHDDDIDNAVALIYTIQKKFGLIED